MTTEELRKVIKVNAWSLSAFGLTISYERADATPKILHLILTLEEAFKELCIVGSAEEFVYPSNVGKMTPIQLERFANTYNMCQWEALSIAIRHEAAKELEEDINLFEIDKLLEALR